MQATVTCTCCLARRGDPVWGHCRADYAHNSSGSVAVRCADVRGRRDSDSCAGRDGQQQGVVCRAHELPLCCASHNDGDRPRRARPGAPGLRQSSVCSQDPHAGKRLRFNLVAVCVIGRLQNHNCRLRRLRSCLPRANRAHHADKRAADTEASLLV